MRRTNLLRWLGCSAVVLGFGGAVRAADGPSAAKIDLKFIENTERTNSWYGFSKGPDGLIRRPMGKPGQFLIIQAADGKVRVDTNGDGRIGDGDEPAFTPEKSKGTRVHLPIEVGGKTVKYPLDIQLEEWGAMVGSAAVLEGKFGGQTITIRDGNIDGRFGTEGDQVQVQKPGQPVQHLPWSQAMAFDGQIYRLQMLANGAQLKLDPYTGPVAEVTIQAADEARNLQVTLQEAENAQVAQIAPSATALLIPGKYRIMGMHYQAGPADRPQYLSGNHDYQAAPLDLKAGKNIVKVGPPLNMSFNATRTGLTLDLADVKITGVAGEMYRPYVDANQGDKFAVYIKAGEKEQELGKLEFG